MHCHAQCLNSALAESAKSSIHFVDFFTMVAKLYSIIANSPKHHATTHWNTCHSTCLNSNCRTLFFKTETGKNKAEKSMWSRAAVRSPPTGHIQWDAYWQKLGLEDFHWYGPQQEASLIMLWTSDSVTRWWCWLICSHLLHVVFRMRARMKKRQHGFY